MGTKFKFNSGNSALVCSSCGGILKTGNEFTEDEWRALRGEIDLGNKYCGDCEGTNELPEEEVDTMSNLNKIKDILPLLKDDPRLQNELFNSIMKKLKK